MQTSRPWINLLRRCANNFFSLFHWAIKIAVERKRLSWSDAEKISFLKQFDVVQLPKKCKEESTRINLEFVHKIYILSDVLRIASARTAIRMNSTFVYYANVWWWNLRERNSVFVCFRWLAYARLMEALNALMVCLWSNFCDCQNAETFYRR